MGFIFLILIYVYIALSIGLVALVRRLSKKKLYTLLAVLFVFLRLSGML